MQISVTELPSKTTKETTLPQDSTAIGRTLAEGHLPSVADAIMNHKQLYSAVLDRFVQKVNAECQDMCKHTLPLSPFRKMDAADQCGSFEWKTFVEDLKKKAPTLHTVFSCIVSRSDQHPNRTHYPGLCMSVAILLKERNREMSGLQYIVSLLLYSSHVDKQVCDRNALMYIQNHK